VSTPLITINTGTTSGPGQGYCGYQYYKPIIGSCANVSGSFCGTNLQNEEDRLPSVDSYQISSTPDSAVLEFVVKSWHYIPGSICGDDDTHTKQGSAEEDDSYYQISGSC
jgi:hypothetical protein